MERKFTFAFDEYYHIYNRGTDRRLIFLDEPDYKHFLKLLYLCNGTKRVELRLLPRGKSPFEADRGETLVNIGCYCLMPNHFHLLLHEKAEGGISKFMLKLITAYVMYFNRKYLRSGGLFEDNFKAIHVGDDRYLEYLFAYIHLNPIKLIEPNWKETGISNLVEARNYLNTYPYSSYQDFLGHEREQSTILNREAFPEYFEGAREFADFHDQWLQFGDDFTVDGRDSLAIETTE